MAKENNTQTYMPGKKSSSFRFAQAFEELEQITQWFESEAHTDLDEGIKKFERGLALASALKARLGEVEQKVQEIKKHYTQDV
jgi:exodeoxyribonuclease VII small subunit